MLLSALLILFLAGASDAPAVGTGQRVIWIAIDSLRADHLHYLGYAKETCPWMDEFAARSADFRLAIAPSNATVRSVAAYFTGKYSFDLLDKDPALYIAEEETTVAEILKSAGFRTLAWSTNMRLVAEEGFGQGFDEYHGLYPASAPKAGIDELVEHIRRVYRPSGGREFIYVHTMDVHLPYRPPIPYDRMFAPPYGRDVVKEGALVDVRGAYICSNYPYFSQVHHLEPIDIEFALSQYDGAIRYTDAKLPELLDTFAYDPAQDLVIISSDHGEQFFEHRFWGHGKLLFPEEVHVPLLIGGRGIVPGQRRQPVSLMDLPPTLAEMYGVPIPQGLAGQSLLSNLRERAEDERFVVSEHVHRQIPAACVVGGGYMYQVCGNAHVFYPWRVWPFIEELYDLTADPGCVHDLAASQSAKADAFNEILRRLNPRFAPFTPDLIRHPAGEIEFGPDLFAQPGLITTVNGTEATNTEDGIALEVPEALAYIKATVPEPRRAYLLEVDYELSSGVLILKLQRDLRDPLRYVDTDYLPLDEQACWYYECHKPTQHVQTLSNVVYPRSTDTFFIAALSKPGKAVVRAVRLRRAYIPEIPGLIPLPTAENRVEPPVLSPEEKARLTSLGYLQ